MSEIDKVSLPSPGGVNQSAINYGQGGNKAKPNHTHGQADPKFIMGQTTGKGAPVAGGGGR